jgi:hypothetical protein
MSNEKMNYMHIPGWGVDAHEDQNQAELRHSLPQAIAERPPQQYTDKEILHSNERPGLSAVYGTPLEPSGWSGKLRRCAFKYSESKLQHWLLLLAADRLQVAEGIIEDLSTGHIPNIPKEKGWPAKWKYNKMGFIRDGLICAAAISLTYMLLSPGKKKNC